MISIRLRSSRQKRTKVPSSAAATTYLRIASARLSTRSAGMQLRERTSMKFWSRRWANLSMWPVGVTNETPINVQRNSPVRRFVRWTLRASKFTCLFLS
ncbi:hypothetical protein BIW11_03188 [Tropilaelaps mercedesae]|uniref:Uncharacterized protein n=1 Tax=Tropilaelaps mercedesae TaxID=418985 RepID=A0A1V9XQR6_9ACAR|nr:hypothetical protein BIW11_03188 [Tropilaelaps mercedesae]